MSLTFEKLEKYIMKESNKECSYKDLPLDENDDYDLDAFSDEQLTEFYWDHPEALPDTIPSIFN